MMRYISLFSGIEAASVAWQDLGWEPVAFSEIEKFPCDLLAQRFPTVPNLGDITKINWEKVKQEYGAVDLIVGGSPCQSFSIAGTRTGLAGQSGLMFEYIRAVRELRPRWFVWENVPGAFTVESGHAFEQLLTEMDDLGYGLAWRVLDAQFFGVPQRRRRVFLIGSLGTTSSADVLFERESMSGDIKSSKQKRAELTAAATNGPRECYTLKLRHTGTPNHGGGDGPLIQDDMSATLKTNQDQTVFVKSRNAQSNTDHGTWVESDTMRTLNCLENRNDTRDTAVIVENNAIPINTMIATRERKRKDDRQGLGIGESGDTAFTLMAGHEHAVCCMQNSTGKSAIDEELAGTLTVGGDAPFIIKECQGFTRERIVAQVDDNLSQTLQAAAGTSGNNQPCVLYKEQDV